jgi:hypothetical protein
VTTALAAYEIANAGPTDAWAIANDVATRSGLRLDEIAGKAVHRLVRLEDASPADGDPAQIADRARQELRYALARDQRAVESVTTLMGDNEQTALTNEIRGLREQLQARFEQAEARVDLALSLAQQGEGGR